MVTFQTLWGNFPDGDKMKKLCTNKQKDSNKPFSDYCAIMLSECFIRSGVDLSVLPGKRCWSHGGRKHILLAEEFALALSKRPPLGVGRREKINPGAFQEILKKRTGVIFFKDYWQRGSESFERRSGDHIDLWNENEITSGSMLYRSVVEYFGFVSDLNKSKEIWFWEIK